MRATTDTRTSILDLAQDFIQTRSMTGFSFQDLAKGVGVKKGSLYYHFESKEELVIALLERAQDKLIDSFRQVENASAFVRLETYLNIYGTYFGASKKMCPGGSFASIWGTVSEPLKKVIQQLGETHINEITRIVESGRGSGEFKQTDSSPREVAIWIVSTVQGAMLTSRMMESDSSFKITMKQLKDFLKNS